MKKIKSLLLVCVLLIGCVFTLASCVLSAGPVTVISGEYEADLALAEYKLTFSPFGKITVVEEPIIGDSTTYEGKYKVNSETKEITLTWKGDAPSALVLPDGTASFSYGEKDGTEYVQIGLVTFKADK